LKGYLGSGASDLPQPQLAAASSADPVIHTTPIEQIPVGHRVLGENPELSEEDRAHRHYSQSSLLE
jgi:hypothetical protein